jgi:recombination protein RecT
MSTQATPSGGHTVQTRELDPAVLFEQVLQRTEKNKRVVLIDGALQARIDRLEELLPPVLKGHGARLAKRAVLTFSRSPKLQACSADSFVRCVLEAAELGLAIDGRLGHAVPFNNKVKDADGVERWRMEATFIPDYRGLVAVAKRGGLIRDVRADVVCQNDHFEARRDGDRDILIHRRDLRQKRGPIYAAYTIVVLPDSTWRHELMDQEELDKVRSRSKSYSAEKPSGPWVTDEAEMCKKTVVKRALKLYTEDPALRRALDADDRDVDLELPPSVAGLPTPARPAPAAAGPRLDPARDDATLPDSELGREPGEEG